MTDFPAKITEDDVQRQQQLINIVKSGQSGRLDNVDIDMFTAKLVLLAAHKLSGNNRVEFFHLPINKMVAIAYKLATQ